MMETLKEFDYKKLPELALVEPDVTNLTDKRVIVQHSVFVYAKEGYIEPEKYDAISVPPKLKKELLEHLRQMHNVDTNSIHNDPVGFLENERNYRTALSHFYRGNAYGRRGEYASAIEEYDKAIDLNPDFSSVYNNRGLAHFYKVAYDLAIADYSEAIKLKPDFAEAYHNRGNTYLEKGKNDNAIADYSRAIDLKPNNFQAYYNRGIVYWRMVEYGSAIADFTKAIELKPDYTESYYNRNILFLILQQWDDARSDLSKAQEKGLDIVAKFKNDFDTLAAFEKKYKVKLPDDIAEMLGER